ncbi:GGDEF domain-containing protein [Paenibacillus glycinis]|uniref:Diguanylate cyclase n=1 Tax=Paenibacillus glycinis TaxID=2697035 RepID=A0ABW9XR93_9BACL|nr:sensor domain-containing diguanylate cyclase [Paenibacillus glycinis]NBD25171.1 diguanylate cyclase [Paenibacillus glycinis]
MSLSEALAPLFFYLLPILFFMYMGLDVFLRDTKSPEHRLVSIMIACYFLLFLEEFIRYELPMAYSGALSAKWFGNVGILIPGIGSHVLTKFARFDRRMPRYLYPYVFYLPLIAVAINLVSAKRIISTDLFVQQGVWKMPIYNAAYYITITASLIVSAFFLFMVAKGKSNAATAEHKAVYGVLNLGAILVLVWTVITGYFQFGDRLPPYPYIYAGLIWCFALRLAMIRFDFLNFSDKKYEKLFNLNPAAILLLDLQGRVKEANPSAQLLFRPIALDKAGFYELAGEQVKARIQGRQDLKEFETTIIAGERRIDVLMDGDYVLADNEPHIILIIRDITAQKENQNVITFLAYHDPLTQLPNRRFFYEKLEAEIGRAGAEGRQLALVLVDLDLFKETNDTYGHKAGDEVLKHAARLIGEAVAGQGMAARFGGDEFVFYLSGIPAESAADFVHDLLIRLQQSLVDDVLYYGQLVIPIGMSMGVSMFPRDGDGVDALLNSADDAMYQVKRAGRNHFQLR